MPATPIPIVGAPGSPYSRTLRAVLRYRRIPHAWINQGPPESRGLPAPLLPQLILAWLRADHAALAAADRAAVDTALAGSGCEFLFA